MSSKYKEDPMKCIVNYFAEKYKSAEGNEISEYMKYMIMANEIQGLIKKMDQRIKFLKEQVKFLEMREEEER